MRVDVALFASLLLFACGERAAPQAQTGPGPTPRDEPEAVAEAPPAQQAPPSEPEPPDLREFVTEAGAAEGIAHLRSVPSANLPAACTESPIAWSRWLEGASDGTFEAYGVCRDDRCLLRLIAIGDRTAVSLHVWYESPAFAPTVTRCEGARAG